MKNDITLEKHFKVAKSNEARNSETETETS